MRLVLESGNGKALPLDALADETHTVRDILHGKHPDGMPLSPQVVTDSIPQPMHPIIFEGITGSEHSGIRTPMEVLDHLA